MKRDPRLRALSAEHHHALVLARRLLAGGADAVWLRERWDAMLAPHFAIEEELLLPGLERAGGAAPLIARTLEDHGALRAALEAAESGDAAALGAFATRLIEHVRFEERELFPACEEKLEPAILDEVARRGRP